MTINTTKPDSLQPTTEMAVDLFDNWFDPIETEVRARARQFIEELIRGELDAALARPHYGRSKMAGNKARAEVTGHRHGSRTRSLTGTFGPIEIAVPRARLTRPEGGTVEEPGAAGLSAAYACRRRADREQLSRRHQYQAGASGARGLVRRDGRQGHGEPDLAQGEERLGRLEQSLIGRGANRAPDPRWHRRPGAARPQGDLDLAARRPWRARRWSEGSARDQEHGRR